MAETQRQLSPEEIREDLTQPIVFHKDAKSYFTGEKLEKLGKIFQDPTVIDLDIMANEPEVKDDFNFIDYCDLLPEWRKLNREFYKALDDLFEHYKKRIPGAVKRTFDVEKNHGLTPIIDLIEHFGHLVTALSPDGHEFPTPFRGLLGKRFISIFHTKLSYTIIDEIKKLPNTVEIKRKKVDVSRELQKRFQVVLQYFHHLAQQNREHFIAGTPGIAEHDAAMKIKTNNKKFSNSFEEIEKAATTKNADELETEIDEQHETICELVNDIDWENFEYNGGKFKIQFINIRKVFAESDMKDVAKGGYLFKCRIILDPTIQKEINSGYVKGGALVFNYEPGFFEVMSETDNSNLIVSYGVTAEVLMKDKAQYLKICNAVYEIFANHLLELESKKTIQKDQVPTVKTVSQKTAEAVETTLETNEITPSPTWVWPGKPEETHKLQTTTDEEEEKEEKKKTGISLRNRKGNRVLRALESILGPAIRCEGTSHYIFKGREGNNYPIAIHGDKDVGVGLLKKCLSMYGISREEFSEAY